MIWFLLYHIGIDMTTQEFLKFASAQPLYNQYHGCYKNGELDELISQNYSSGHSPEKIIEFFTSVGRVAFERDEKNRMIR